MPDDDGAVDATGPEAPSDAEDDAADTKPGDRGPRAVPRPSLASRDMPVPKPASAPSPRPAPPRATPVPSKASRDAPVPKPIRSKSPVGGVPRATPRPDAPPPRTVRPKTPVPRRGAKGGSGTIFEPTPGVTPAGLPDDAPRRESFGSVTRTTRPGTTQAMQIGGWGDKKARFTTHRIRGEDRVSIRDDIEVAYRFLAATGPDAYPDVHRGWLVDLSLTGAQIEGVLPADPPRRDLTSGAVIVRLKANLPYVDEPLVVDSQVTWVKAANGDASLVGLKFAGLTQQQSNLIRAFFIGLQSPTRTKFRRGRPEGPA